MQRPKQRQSVPAYIKAIKEVYNPDDVPPRFSFRFLVKHPDFGFESLNDSNKIALADTLNRLSQLKWAELRLAPRHGLGYEKIEKSALNFILPRNIPTDRSIRVLPMWKGYPVSMNNLPARKPNRLKGYNYSRDGAYFVTICTRNRENLFGRIIPPPKPCLGASRSSAHLS